MSRTSSSPKTRHPDALAEPEPAAATPRDAYASLILGQANLFLDRNYLGKAEPAYQLANQLSPSYGETVTAYRSDDGRQWKATGSEKMNLGPTAFVGFAATSAQDATHLPAVVFDNVIFIAAR